MCVGLDAAQQRALEVGQRHDSAGPHPLAARAQGQLAVGELGAGGAVERDPGVAQQQRERIRDPRPEHRERRGLGTDDRDVDVDVHVEGAMGRHKRELVERKRPARRCRSHERDLLDVALLDILHEAAQRAAEVAIVDRHRTFERRPDPRATGDDEHVVLDPGARAGDHPSLLRLHCIERAGHDIRAEVRGDLRQLDTMGVRDRERLGHRHRPVVEVALGGEQRDADIVAGERTKGHHDLERRDTTARDEHVESCWCESFVMASSARTVVPEARGVTVS